MELHFLPYAPEYKNPLIQLIFGLYEADAAGETITQAKIEQTIVAFQNTPSLGDIILVTNKNKPIGYAILINYWSNEYGGIIKFIDEIYIDQSFRGRGIGSQFINHLIQERFANAVAFALEVMPNNTRAVELYQKLGFREDGRHHLFYHQSTS